MKKYDIRITASAAADMQEIYEYIAVSLQAPDNAMAQYDRIAEAIMSLETMPNRVKIMDFTSKSNPELRRMLVDNYSVFFVIENDSVIVTNVLFSASEIESRLK